MRQRTAKRSLLLLLVLIAFFAFSNVALFALERNASDVVDLIGSPGHFDGPASRYVGLSGTYDSELFSVSEGTIFPSIRLTSLDNPRCYIEFSNPIQLDLPDGVTADSEPLMSHFWRIDNRGPVGPMRLIEDWQIEAAEDGAEATFTYTLHAEAGITEARIATLERFSNSVGLIVLALDPEREDTDIEIFEEALSRIEQTEGKRPAIDLAASFNEKLDPDSAYIPLDWFTSFEMPLSDEEPRLNADLLDALYLAMESTTKAFEWHVFESRAQQLKPSRADKEMTAELKALPFIDILHGPEEESGERPEHYAVNSVKLAHAFNKYLPASYHFIETIYTENGDYLSLPDFQDDEAFDILPTLYAQMQLVDGIDHHLHFDAPYVTRLLEPVAATFVNLLWYQTDVTHADREQSSDSIVALADHFEETYEAPGDLLFSYKLLSGNMRERIKENGGSLEQEAITAWLEETFYYTRPDQ